MVKRETGKTLNDRHNKIELFNNGQTIKNQHDIADMFNKYFANVSSSGMPHKQNQHPNF